MNLDFEYFDSYSDSDSYSYLESYSYSDADSNSPVETEEELELVFGHARICNTKHSYPNDFHLYQDPSLRPAISKAVFKGDVEEIKLLLESDKGVNSPDNNGNTPLHLAIINNASMEIINLLLSHPDIDLESKNYMGYTPLLYGLHKSETNPDIIMHLIEAGCSVNAKNNVDESTMHLAVTYHPSERILVKLIKKGADINAQDYNGCTVLHRALTYEYNGNGTAIYVLLYYGVDVSICCECNWNPIMHALDRRSGFAEVLFDYYDFNDSEEFGFECLHIATGKQNPIAMDLLKAGVNINYEMESTRHPIYESIKYPDSKLFKEMWPRVDYEQIIQGRFLEEFIDHCNFPTSEWLECCYLILNCSHVSELVIRPVYTDYSFFGPQECLYNLFTAFYKKNIQKNDRVAIIYIILSYGTVVHMQTLQYVYLIYGPNEELEALIQASDQYQLQKGIYDNFCVFLQFYVLLEEEIIKDDIVGMIARQITHYLTRGQEFDQNMAKNIILDTLQLFSITHYEKVKLLQLFSIYRGFIQNPAMDIEDNVMDKLAFMPDIPSLTEMSRNQTRKFIKQAFKIKQPYQFYDVVKRLNIPYVIKDIITLKKPIFVPMYT